jgi:hypothetical protein
VAGLTEESPKLVPLVVVALVAPGRVRRFAATDVVGRPEHGRAAEFSDRLAATPGAWDPGLARAAVDLLRTLPTTATREVLLVTDLHAGTCCRRSANRGGRAHGPPPGIVVKCH